MPGKYLLKQITLRQANISITIFKEEAVTNLWLKESGGGQFWLKRKFCFYMTCLFLVLTANAEAMFF
jgi:hypothetical protein